MKRKRHRHEREHFIMFLTGHKMAVFKLVDLKPKSNSFAYSLKKYRRGITSHKNLSGVNIEIEMPEQ